MKVVVVESPNHSARPADVAVSCVVLHSDAADDAKKTISWLRSKKSGVSYHALVDRDGTVYRFVGTGRKAWHAGDSAFVGVPHCNNYSLGLAFANKNDGVEPYTEQQYESGALVVLDWMHRFPAITPERVTTHAIVALPDGRKNDPLGFDLARFKALLRPVDEP